MHKRAIIFDRDGTLIKTFITKKNEPAAIKKLKDFKLLSNVKSVIKILSKKFLIIVFTNQPDVSRGKNTKANVKEINLKLAEVLKINKIYTCYSDNNQNYMRKPNPGMIYAAKKKFNLNLKESFVVGDRNKDILAGKKANCITILIKKKYNKKNSSNPDYIVSDFKELLKIINFY
mgnify:CR=1 FL=1|tara:strand:+ start:474 stop:998 length:525 start_codon:yes stop_codon:yes gene_type:complete